MCVVPWYLGIHGERLYPGRVHTEEPRRQSATGRLPSTARVLQWPRALLSGRGKRKWARNVLKQNKFVSFYIVGPMSQNIQFPLNGAHVTPHSSPYRVQNFCDLRTESSDQDHGAILVLLELSRPRGAKHSVAELK